MNVITSGAMQRACSQYFSAGFRYSPGIDTY
jgi:hypothetical protein